jgi:hypothetical protein
MATPAGMDITEAAQRVGALAWAEQRLFEIVGGWVASTSEPDAKVRFARLSRLHGDHVVALVAVLPDTRDHDPDALVAPPEGPDPMRVLDGVDSTDARVRALVEGALPAQIAGLEAFLSDASTVRDAPSQRVVGAVLAEDRSILDELRSG